MLFIDSSDFAPRKFESTNRLKNEIEEFLYYTHKYIEDCCPGEVSISYKEMIHLRVYIVGLSKLSNIHRWLFQIGRTTSLHQKQLPLTKAKGKMAAEVTPSSRSMLLVTNHRKEYKHKVTTDKGISKCDSSYSKDGGDNQVSHNSSNKFIEGDLTKVNKQAKYVQYEIKHSQSRDFAPGGDDMPPGRDFPGGCQQAQDVHPRLEVDTVLQFLIDLPPPTAKMILPKIED